MRSRTAEVERNWRRTLWFFRFFPFWIALILGINLWDDHSKGQTFDWTLIWVGLSFLAFTGGLYIVSRLIYKFVRRYAQHRDNHSP